MFHEEFPFARDPRADEWLRSRSRSSGRPSSRRSLAPLRLLPSRMLTTLAPAAAASLRPEMFWLSIIDPEQRVGLSATTLREAYGLTATEAEVAVAIAAGDTPREIAEAQGVSVNATRTHLRALFQKTETRGQPQLARVLMRNFAVNG